MTGRAGPLFFPRKKGRSGIFGALDVPGFFLEFLVFVVFLVFLVLFVFLVFFLVGIILYFFVFLVFLVFLVATSGASRRCALWLSQVDVYWHRHVGLALRRGLPVTLVRGALGGHPGTEQRPRDPMY